MPERLANNDLVPGFGTFMSAPGVSEQDHLDSNVVVLGVPFDCGTSQSRIGARHGPEAIRRASRMLGPYHEHNPAIHLLEAHDLVDIGDVRVIPGAADDSFPRISNAGELISGSGAVPLSFGGDGAISLPLLRGISKVWPDLVCIHVDSHTDTYPVRTQDVSPYTTATTFFHVAEEDLIDAGSSVHLGIHGDASIPDHLDLSLELGYRVITLDELLATGLTESVSAIKELVQDRPVYVCFDMDIFDPSCAPGVCNPTWGGLSAREGIKLVRCLNDFNIVAIDINTVSPPHDPGDMTAWLAATVAHEFLAVLL